MTLLDMIRQTLIQLERGTSAETIEAWRDKLTQYFNDGLEDIVENAPLHVAERVPVERERISLFDLTKQVTRIMGVFLEGERLAYFENPADGELIVPGVHAGEVTVLYCYSPRLLSIDTDVPEIPAYAHGALVLYAVGRERAMQDSASLSAANACFELYRRKKRALWLNESNAYSSRISWC